MEQQTNSTDLTVYLTSAAIGVQKKSINEIVN